MAERLSNAWTTILHFYLAREGNASRLMAWRNAQKDAVGRQAIEKITDTDLLVQLVAAALEKHPRLSASWQANEIVLHKSINVGLAVVMEERVQPKEVTYGYEYNGL